MSRAQPSLDSIFQTHIQTLALTLRRDTVTNYRCVAHRFLGYLHSAFPRVCRLSQLRRDPHLLGWFRWMCQQDTPLCNKTRGDYLLGLRRLLDDLTANGHAIQPDLIRREDFPPRPQYLPRPLSPRDDQLLGDELRRTDDLPANALLLTRATGIRIGECIDLALDCLRQLGPGQWALHVPLGKLHTERLVPADVEVRRVVARILVLRALAPPARLAKSEGFLLPRYGGHYALYQTLRPALAQAAKRAGCSGPVTPHQLRHTFASEMLRRGVSLPALMQLLGHKDIRMTLRYVQVTQQDLQREFLAARQPPIRYPFSRFPIAPPALILPVSASQSLLHAIFSKCTAANWAIPKSSANFSAWINGSSRSPTNSTASQPKNDEILASQVAHPAGPSYYTQTGFRNNFYRACVSISEQHLCRKRLALPSGRFMSCWRTNVTPSAK